MKAKLFMAALLISTFSMAGTISIAVAANVSYAIDDLKKAFNKQYPDTDVKVTLGGSGKLTAQIKNGAPYEMLMSANMKYPEALYKEKLAVTEPVVYAWGSLAILSSRKKDFSQKINIVLNKQIRTIAIANPKSAPYGKAAVEALKNAGVYEKVKHKFVNAESISQTVAYTVTAADIGFIAKSSLYSSKMAKFRRGDYFIDVDPKLYAPISQGMVILKKGEKKREVRAFYDFILGPKAKEIFKKYGYRVNE